MTRTARCHGGEAVVERALRRAALPVAAFLMERTMRKREEKLVARVCQLEDYLLSWGLDLPDGYQPIVRGRGIAETALGHRPKCGTVPMTHTHTDAALAVLRGSD